jgi:hypothetical protein
MAGLTVNPPNRNGGSRASSIGSGDSSVPVGDPAVIRRLHDRAVQPAVWPIEQAVDPRP